MNRLHRQPWLVRDAEIERNVVVAGAVRIQLVLQGTTGVTCLWRDSLPSKPRVGMIVRNLLGVSIPASGLFLQNAQRETACFSLVQMYFKGLFDTASHPH